MSIVSLVTVLASSQVQNNYQHMFIHHRRPPHFTSMHSSTTTLRFHISIKYIKLTKVNIKHCLNFICKNSHGNKKRVSLSSSSSKRQKQWQ